MNILVDSSVWIDSFNPKVNSREKELLEKLISNDCRIYLCPVIYHEVLQGIKDEKIFEQIKSVFLHYRMINFDIMNVTNYVVDLYRHLRKTGITIRKSVDCLIASYAILADMYLLHNDSDFSLITAGSRLKTVKV